MGISGMSGDLGDSDSVRYPRVSGRRQMVLTFDMERRKEIDRPDATHVAVKCTEEYTRMACVCSADVIDWADKGDDLSAVLDDVANSLAHKMAHEIEGKLLIPQLREYIRRAMEVAKKGCTAKAGFPDAPADFADAAAMVRRDAPVFGVDSAKADADMTAMIARLPMPLVDYGASVDVSEYMKMVGSATGTVVDKILIDAMSDGVPLTAEDRTLADLTRMRIDGDFVSEEKVPEHKRHPSEITDDGDDVIIK